MLMRLATAQDQLRAAWPHSPPSSPKPNKQETFKTMLGKREDRNLIILRLTMLVLVFRGQPWPWSHRNRRDF